VESGNDNFDIRYLTSGNLQIFMRGFSAVSYPWTADINTNHSLCYVMDNTANEIRLAFDGDFVVNQTVTAVDVITHFHLFNDKNGLQQGNVKMDLVGIWDRDFNQTELEEYHNNGVPTNPYSTAAPVIVIDNITANNVSFINNSFWNTNYMGFQLDLINQSTNPSINTTFTLYNSTNSLIGEHTINNTLNPAFNFTGLNDDSYFINFNATNNVTSTSSSNYSFTIDLTPPSIVDNLPSEINSYDIDLSNFITCSDIDGGYCNITFQPDANTSNTSLNYTFNFNGNQTYIIIANDSAGNAVNSTGTILVNPQIYFGFNDSGTLLVNYTLGGITFTNQEYANLTIYDSPVNGLGIKNLDWTKFGYADQTIGFTLTNTSVFNTTYNVSQSTINIEIRDKDTLNLITGTNFSLEFIATVSAETTTITGLATLSNLLFQSEQYQVIISGSGYETEEVYFNFDNQENLTVIAYMINSTEPRLGFVVASVTGSNSEPLSGVTVQARQWDSSSSSYLVVSQGVTSSDGTAPLNVILNDKAYIFRAINGVDTISSPSETITTSENGKTIPLPFQDIDSVFTWDLGEYQGTASQSINTTTNISTITFDYSHSDGIAVTACINLYKVVDNIERLNTVSCNTSVGGTFIKSYFINSSQFNNIKAEFLINGDYDSVATFKHTPTTSIQNILISTGLHAFVLLLLIAVSIWIGFELLDNIYISLVLIIVSVFVSSSLIPTIIPNTIATVFGVMASLTIWGIYKRK